MKYKITEENIKASHDPTAQKKTLHNLAPSSEPFNLFPLNQCPALVAEPKVDPAQVPGQQPGHRQAFGNHGGTFQAHGVCDHNYLRSTTQCQRLSPVDHPSSAWADLDTG